MKSFGESESEYQIHVAKNTRAFLDRVSVQGVNEARELVRSADFLESIALKKNAIPDENGE